jgi:hypothetical protein
VTGATGTADGAVPALDHVFVVCPPGAEEAAGALEGVGLRCGRARVHPGQGTENRCYWIGSLMVELLWVHDPGEARTGPAAPLALADRADWHRTGASPVGLALRPGAGVASGDLLPDGLDYAAPFLPAGRTIRVAAGAPEAPLVFVSPGRSDPPDVPHAFRDASVTRVEVHAPFWHAPSTCEALDAAGVVRRTGPPLLALTVSGRALGVDLRPGVALVVR